MQLPVELQKEIDAVVQYLVYNFRRQSSIDMQLGGIDPTPYLDHTFGYDIHIGVVKTDDGWRVSGMTVVGMVDGTNEETTGLPDIESDEFGSGNS